MGKMKNKKPKQNKTLTQNKEGKRKRSTGIVGQWRIEDRSRNRSKYVNTLKKCKRVTYVS